MLSLIGVLVLYWLLHISLWGLYQKAGRPGWHTLVPVLQDITLLDIIGRKKHHAIWGLIPYINFLFNLTWLADLLNSYNRRSFAEHSLGILFGFIYFPYLATRNIRYIGPAFILDRQNKVRRSTGREWADAIFFAIIAATIIRTFNVEAYKIPSQSMEGTLLAGDFLFVSKMHYGARLPITPIAFPLGHQTFPGTEIKCYLDKPSLPYKRLPGFQKVERGDAVVFNFPMEDDRPIDKKTNYIKRCIGLPGETIEVNAGQVIIDGQKMKNPDHLQYQYYVATDQRGLNMDALERLDINASEIIAARPNLYLMFLEENQASCIAKMPGVVEIQRYVANYQDQYSYNTFPGDTSHFKWTVDYFGPLLIPKKGMTVQLSPANISLYKRAIEVYEGNQVQVANGQVSINGQVVSSYTFQQDYYFMMGDNRHNSEDSRIWGFVPENHIVGKAWLVWMCMQPGKGFRLDRFMKPVQGDKIQQTSIKSCN